MQGVVATFRGLVRISLLGLSAALVLTGAAHLLSGLERVPDASASLPHLAAAAKTASAASIPALLLMGAFTGALAFSDPTADGLRQGARRAAVLGLVPAAAGYGLLAPVPSPIVSVLVVLCLATALLALAWCRPLARAPATAGAAALVLHLVFLALERSTATTSTGQQILGALSTLVLALAAVLGAVTVAFVAVPRPGTGRLG